MFSSLVSHLPTSISSVFERVSETILTPEAAMHKEIGQFSNDFDAVALNPQPLPPKEIFGLALEPNDLFPAQAADTAAEFLPEPGPAFVPPESFEAEAEVEDDLPSLLEDGMEDQEGAFYSAEPEFPSSEAGFPFPTEPDHEFAAVEQMQFEPELPSLPQIELDKLVEPALMF